MDERDASHKIGPLGIENNLLQAERVYVDYLVNNADVRKTILIQHMSVCRFITSSDHGITIEKQSKKTIYLFML